MRGVYKSSNKMHAVLNAGRRFWYAGHSSAVELTVKDDHQRQVAVVEFRRQPDGEITIAVYGSEQTDAPIYEAVIRRGADRVRLDEGRQPKGPVRDLPVAPGALGRRRGEAA